MKKYILQGNDTDIDKVVRENKIRVARGLIEFVPFNEDSSEGFIDDDVNGIPDENPSEAEEFNDEELDPAPEVSKVILEPLEGATEEVVVTDDKNVTVDDDKSAVSKVEKPKGKRKKSE